MTPKERLWIVANLEASEVIYALGSTARGAWANAYVVVRGRECTDADLKRFQKEQRRKGFRAMHVALVVTERLGLGGF